MNKFLGIFACILLGFLSTCMAGYVTFLGEPIIGLIMGLIFGAVVRKYDYFPKFQMGFRFTQKKLLKLAIIMLGFQMNFMYVMKVGSSSLTIMLVTILSSIVTAVLVGKAMGIGFNTKILIGVGTSICGGSAIMATAPVIEAEENEVIHAISTIFLFNIIGAISFPIMGQLLGLSDVGFGLWAGTAINDTSSVVAAATEWANRTGRDIALEYATIVKLTRTLMIVPITFFLALYKARNQRKSSDRTMNTQWKDTFPWFVIWFMMVVILGSIISYPDWLIRYAVDAGKFMIVMAMVSVGASVDIRYMIKQGLRPILLGLSCSLVVALMAILMQSHLSIW